MTRVLTGSQEAESDRFERVNAELFQKQTLAECGNVVLYLL